MAASLSEVLSFGRYEPLFRVAAGGMAEVYAAAIRGEAGFEKLVAVKRMLPHLAADSGFVEMFLDEARLAAHVDSPFVVSTLDLDRSEDGTLYMVMDFVLGLSLLELRKACKAAKKEVPIPIAIALLAQVARGLDDAHEARTPAGDPLGLIHRDISPHNVLVGIDGRARISDFGVARALRRSQARTQAGEIKGKVGYMSPEQSRQELIDRRSDIFSLGIVAWELLTGERLFDGIDVFDVLQKIRDAKVEPPSRLRPEVPESVSEIVLMALKRHREDRYASAGEMAKALRKVGRELGEPPESKEIGAFVEESGGEPLSKLRELIRLSSEGADEDRLQKAAPAGTVLIRAPSESERRQPREPSPPPRSGTAKMKLPSAPSVRSPPVGSPPQADRRGTRPIRNPTPSSPAARGPSSPPGSDRETRPVRNPPLAPSSPPKAEGDTRPMKKLSPESVVGPTRLMGLPEARPPRVAKPPREASTRPIAAPASSTSPASVTRAPSAAPAEAPATLSKPKAPSRSVGAPEDPSESAPTEVFTRSDELEQVLMKAPKGLRGALARAGAGIEAEADAEADPAAAPDAKAEASKGSGGAAKRARRGGRGPSKPASEGARRRGGSRGGSTGPRPAARGSSRIAWLFAGVALLILLFSAVGLYLSQSREGELPAQTLPE